MSDGMRRELVYLSSYATNRYFIPNWGIFSLFAATRGKQGHKGKEGGEDAMTIFHGYSARRICTDILHVRFFFGKVTKIPLHSNILKNKTTHGA